MAKISPSLKPYLGIFGFVSILRLILFFVPVEYVLPEQEQMTAIPTIVLVFALGILGLRLTPKAGFSEMMTAEITNKQRFLIPALLGLGFGGTAVIFDVLQPLGADIQIKLPGSLLVYSIGGVLEEILFSLLLTTFLVWLISTVLLKAKLQNQVFWIVAVAVGLLYAFLQIGQYSVLTGLAVDLLVVMRFSLIIGLFFVIAAHLFRKYGFLAAVSMRLVYYLVFHLLWGGLILH
jgi:hypothetical protein